MCIAYLIIGTCTHRIGTRTFPCFPTLEQREFYCLGIATSPTPEQFDEECDECIDHRIEVSILEWCRTVVSDPLRIGCNDDGASFVRTPPATPLNAGSVSEREEQEVESGDEDEYKEPPCLCPLRHPLEIFLLMLMVMCIFVELLLLFILLNK
ncbi:hypothetical protein BKA61DRAFT_566462 [Leptodontidium sp. MPI-SDFR-AT-0119]|nr:hypothetical protein BKA61DRAFT_566462 [Leptodontidium sp. MPI-SDFR-AT-0119]